MKRVIALKAPELPKGDPGLFAARLAYERRDVEEELALIELTRRQMARILSALNPEDFQRRGAHSRDGALTLEKWNEQPASHEHGHYDMANSNSHRRFKARLPYGHIACMRG
jgi:hypothetical protein